MSLLERIIVDPAVVHGRPAIRACLAYAAAQADRSIVFAS